MTNHRTRGARRAASVIGVVSLVGAAAALPAQAEPDVADAKAKVDSLYEQAEQAQERYNEARLRLDSMSSEVSSLKSDEKRQDRRLAAVREQVRDSVVRQYQGEGVSTVGQVVVSEDPSGFLNRLATLQTFSDMQADVMESYTAEVKALDLRQDATRSRRQEVKQTTAILKAEKAEVAVKLASAKKVLDRLAASQRRELQADDAGTTTDVADLPPVKASGRAKDAVAYALAQVGDSYVHGAAGPNAFDCSGLTMMAWAQAGVSLPHSSSMQFSGGRKIDRNDLQPGDLVFYYSPISHVGIYIGGGKIVHAANPRTGVRVAPVFSMRYAGAVRPG